MLKHIVLFALLILITAGNVAGIEIKTDFTEEKYYRTSGIFNTDASFAMVREVLTDFHSYSEWATKGLDGKEPGTEDFIGLLKDTAYNSEQNIFSLFYDVRLPWPFGSLDNRALFTVHDLIVEDNRLSFDLSMIDTSAVLKDAKLHITVCPEIDGCRIESTALVRFTFILNLFFNLSGYRKTIEWRIVKILTNMESYIESYAVCSAAEAEG